MRVGAPTAILGFVIYTMFSGLSSNAASAANHSRQAVEIVSELQKVTQEIAASSRRMEYYEWVKCIRASQSEADRALCGPKPESK